ncbi:MBL fold metallo-hydrolase [Thiohalobacter sp. IOR34]|uniref:MBL fold metallo-hydrolase n=1 Tax=Thiohalobacter sp. IOR34 TaxID=3057176 RepID=UPI0025B03232|nr:MBL fold metallo-hydrolase [Thiohalobacter sp. IOR34]WJW76116.1 MBL fold metallo-hydrolase [Thiohalobacter sp. IOR34]
MNSLSATPGCGPDANAPYRIHALELGPMENFVYLIEDRASGRAAVVDPAWEVEEVLRLARERGLRITDILLTHSHHDHINGIETVLAAQDAQLHLLKPEARFWGQALDLPTLHHGGDLIELGETPIEVLHTPGHTPGSACYRLGNDLITGDTLFVFGCGRCDLKGGDPEQMFHTLKDMAERLPPETCIHPGHNYSVAETSTLAEQVEGNPFLHFDDPARFVYYRMHYHDRHRHDPYGPVPKGEEMPEE